MRTYHKTPLKPSSFLSLVCLVILHRLRPEWVAVTLSEAAASDGVAAQRLSRLCSRAIVLFEPIIATLIRIGRPPADREADRASDEICLLRSLLEVATSMLGRVKLRGRAVHALVAGAFLRLKQEHPVLTQEAFCEALSLSPRTLRHWMTQHDTSPADPLVVEQAPKRQPRTRPPRRPRFGFEVTLPDTQMAADTTGLSAFDMPLKLMAAQDVGGRDRDLLDSVIVDDHECANLVVRVLTEAIAGREGIQVITDQGTPYMAEVTREAIEEMGAEHAPQKEADPMGKATLEKAFDTVKLIARPLLSVTNRIARAFSALRDAELAIAFATLVVTALLKAYQAGARAARRADDARAGLDVETLRGLAEQSRQQAHAEERSARLLLTRIHQLYQINCPLNDFVRSMRRYPIEVLNRTERSFALQAHRDDIRYRAAYFASIAQRLNDDYQLQLANRRAEEQQRQQWRQEEERDRAQMAAWNEDPAAWLLSALKAIAANWIPEKTELLFGGRGLGLAWLRLSIRRLFELHAPRIACHIANGVFVAFENEYSGKIGPSGVDAIHALMNSNLPPDPPDTQNTCKQMFGYAILRNTGPPTRPAPRCSC